MSLVTAKQGNGRVLPDLTQYTGGRSTVPLQPTGLFEPIQGALAPDTAFTALRECMARGRTEMLTQVIVVTPEIAQYLLERNENNRNVREKHVRYLANAMMNGEWQLNGQAIVVARDGKLNDGQHRLHAVIDANCVVPMLFVFGVERLSRETLDQGRKRTHADIFGMTGWSNSNHLAAACRLLHAYDQGGLARSASNNHLTPQQAMTTAERHPSLERAIVDVTKLRSELAIPVGGAVAGHALCLERYPAQAEMFFDHVLYGTGKRGEGPLALRMRLMRHSAKTERLRPVDVMYMWMSAFGSWRRGNSVQVLKRPQIKWPSL